jgi:hypothetical protein
MLERLERMSVEHKVVDPKREQEVDSLITMTRETVNEIQRWAHERERDERFMEFLDALGKSTAAAERRLATSEKRLAQVEDVLSDRGEPLWTADPAIIAEGRFLADALAGPSPAGVDVKYLKDAPPPKPISGVDQLFGDYERRRRAAASKP